VTKSRKRRWHIQWKGEVHTEFWWGNLKERDHLKYPGVGGKTILKWIIKKWEQSAWIRLVWVRIGIRVELLRVRS
jgi:hypothetical protein